MTRVAVVGVGAMGRNHARVYRDMKNVDLVAVADEQLGVASEVGRLYGIPAYSDLALMLAMERPDAVSVVVPTQAHFHVVRIVLEASCHVLVEKPIAASLEEARALAAEADQLGRILMIGHIERFNPAIIELKRRLDAGELGRLFQISARRLGPFPPRVRDVGVVVDLATHDLDIMRHLTGSEVVRCYAETRREVHTSREDLFCGTLRFADDTLGFMEINWLTPTKVRELWITGERGLFRADYLTQDLYFFENADADVNQWTNMSVLRGVSEGSMTRVALRKREPLRAELESFISACSGEFSGFPSAADGAAALALALMLIDSAETNRTKEISTTWR